MIINAKTGRKLIASGNANFESAVTTSDGRRYAAITRYDIQRTDHYPIKDGEDK